MKMDEQRVLTTEEKTDAYVRKKMMEAADAREAELNADPALNSIHLTDAMRADMKRRIAAIDAARAGAQGDAAGGTHDGVHGGVPAGVAAPDNAPGDATGGMHDNVSAGAAAPGNTVGGAANSMAGNGADNAPGSTHDSMPDGVSGNVLCDMPGNASGGTPDGASDAALGNASDNAPAGMAAPGSTSGTTPDVLAMLSEEDRRALELGKKAMRLRKHRKVFRAAAIAAAIGLGVFGISMTSEANRLWWVNLWDGLVGKESYSFMNNAEEKGEIDAQILDICAEIKEKTDINAAYFAYMPQELIFDDYTIREDIGTVNMYYIYQKDKVLTVRMAKKKQDSVTGQIKDGNVLERIPIDTDYGSMEIRAQEAPGGEKNYSVEFVRDDCQYNIHGVLPREEFIYLIEKIIIF